MLTLWITRKLLSVVQNPLIPGGKEELESNCGSKEQSLALYCQKHCLLRVNLPASVKVWDWPGAHIGRVLLKFVHQVRHTESFLVDMNFSS